MIDRYWRGLVRDDQAAKYERHLRDDAFSGLSRMPGYLGAAFRKHHLENGVEFIVITRWTSPDAIAQFADDIEIAVVPAEIQAMMIECDQRARHYEVVEGYEEGDG